MLGFQPKGLDTREKPPEFERMISDPRKLLLLHGGRIDTYTAATTIPRLPEEPYRTIYTGTTQCGSGEEAGLVLQLRAAQKKGGSGSGSSRGARMAIYSVLLRI